ncbi:MAG: SAV_915 family protein [Sciscionella sp.]
MSYLEPEMVLPSTVYVPTGPSHDGDPQLQFELRRTEDGRFALLVYTTLDHLVECCGESQPWVQVPTQELDEVRAYAPFDVVLLDVPPHGKISGTKPAE